MSREAMQLALEALEKVITAFGSGLTLQQNAITALRKALEIEQEPVAWANSFDLQNFDMKVRTGPDLHHTVPLYTAPPKQWVGLTDEEVSEIIDREIGFNSCWGPEEKFARAIEQALKEKNNG